MLATSRAHLKILFFKNVSDNFIHEYSIYIISILFLHTATSPVYPLKLMTSSLIIVMHEYMLAHMRLYNI